MSGFVLAAGLATFVGPVWALPHYSAPFYPLLMALVIFGLRELGVWRWKSRRWGRWAARGIILFFCVYGLGFFLRGQREWAEGWSYQRTAMQARLQADGKKHLVIVRYGPRQNIHQGWVWNVADIDQASVVWANDLGPKENQILLDYFQGYQVTEVEPNHEAVPASK